MNANGERGIRTRGGHRFVEGRGIGEQAGAGNDAGAVGFDDGAIDAGGHAEIVGVDDELLHGSRAAPLQPRRMHHSLRNWADAPAPGPARDAGATK